MCDCKDLSPVSCLQNTNVRDFFQVAVVNDSNMGWPYKNMVQYIQEHHKLRGQPCKLPFGIKKR